jgi:DNA primase
MSARGRKVYIDYLQNVREKTLATAYSGMGPSLTAC